MADMSKYNAGTGARLAWFNSDMPIVKLRDVVDQRFTLKEFGFINTKNGRKCVIAAEELPGRVLFANEIIAETFDQIDADGMHEAACDGETHFTIVTRTSDNGRDYFALVFVK